MIDALDIHVKGIVQGVGFRPFVYRLAKKHLINGWVLNAADGVHIRAEGESKLLDEFVLEISENAPAAAQVSEIEMKEVPLEPFDGFEIRFSEDEPVEETTFVSPDLATCSDCERELFDENDRRYRYPFINCTNCGPRFTIIDSLPYDRASTSMRDFKMCNACQSEYDDPANRRFHAQPNACFECGPHISWSEDAGKTVQWGTTRKESDAIFARAVELLQDGAILAVKGLGGFHLVCDANNAGAVAKLRERKHREGKPFAVMMRDLNDVREVCEVGVEEAAILTGAARPIVLLRKQLNMALTPGVADLLPELGVMLPYTPVQHILLNDFAAANDFETKSFGAGDFEARGSEALPPMLVMTSGNLHDEPIVIDDGESYERLSGIADAFLGNDRRILTRFDDSVVRIIRAGSAGETAQMIRRARGYAPSPVPVRVFEESQGDAAAQGDAALQENTVAQDDLVLQGDAVAREDMTAQDEEIVRSDAALQGDSVAQDGAIMQKDAVTQYPVIFSAGPEQKNTFAFLRGSDAFVSQHIGDMENADAFEAWLDAKKRYEQLFDLKADELACDLHPEYITSKWAREQAALHRPSLPLVEVQHHHAHIASVIAENKFAADEAICGIAFDGTGFGIDGNIWGGEVLLSNLSDFERFINFAYVPMPGGAAAVKHPLQMAYGVLWEFDLLDHPAAVQALAPLGDSKLQNLEAMIEQGINTPVTSSVGRLFDAASALLGICTQPNYEGEPAILLEAAIGDANDLGANSAGVNSAETNGAGANSTDANDAGTNGSGANGLGENDADANGLGASVSDANGPGANGSDTSVYHIEIVKNTATETSTAQDTSVLLFDAAPLFKALLDDVVADVPTATISRRFHDAFVEAIVQAAQLALALYDIGKVTLSGGVFMNRYIIEHALDALERAGFTVAINRELPPNDGCVSYGEAVVACAKKKKNRDDNKSKNDDNDDNNDNDDKNNDKNDE